MQHRRFAVANCKNNTGVLKIRRAELQMSDFGKAQYCKNNTKFSKSVKNPTWKRKKFTKSEFFKISVKSKNPSKIRHWREKNLQKENPLKFA